MVFLHSVQGIWLMYFMDFVKGEFYPTSTKRSLRFIKRRGGISKYFALYSPLLKLLKY